MDDDEGKYTSLALLVEPGQEKRIIRALKSGRGCVIYVRKSGNNTCDTLSSTSTPDSSKLDGNHATRGVLHLTNRHLKRYHKACAGAKVGLNFDRHELEYNRKHRTGGFIPFLLPLLGAIAAGATTSLVDNALSKKKVWVFSPPPPRYNGREVETISRRRLYCGTRNIRRC